LIDLVKRRPIDYGQDAAHWTFKLFNYQRQRGPRGGWQRGPTGHVPVGRWGQSATGIDCHMCGQLSACNMLQRITPLTKKKYVGPLATYLRPSA